jgi:CheY-like chemotaxis protein/HPt (histidine-containing phosphotransfer) domain-containing protein
MLEGAGCRATAVPSAVTALAACRQGLAAGQAFEVALIDRNMPEMDGETLGGLLRSEPLLAGLRLVMLTSAAMRGDAERTRQIGFDAYLTKPIKGQLLYRCLAALRTGSPDSGADRTLITRHTLDAAQDDQVRILLVDDNATNQRVALQMLSRLRLRAAVAGDGRAAIEALALGKFDLVLMDCQMPVLDGFQTTRRIRQGEAGERNTAIRIVAMTASAYLEDRDKCLAAGMDDYLAKPMSLDELKAKLDRWLPDRPPAIAPTRQQVAAEAPEATAAGFDPQVLLDHCAGDQALAREIAALVLADMPQHLATLREAVGRVDATAEARRAAHTMKGLASQVGAASFASLCREVEDCAAGGGAVEPGPLVSLADAWQTLATALETWTTEGA